MDKYLMYLRKSRSDDPNETVEQVLAKHERILQNYSMAMLDHRIPEDCIYREVVSGETIEDRPEVKRVFTAIQSSEIKGVLVVDCQRLSRGDLIDCGTILQNFKYTKTEIVTPKKTFDLNNEYDYKSVKSELMAGSDYLDYMKTIMQRGTLQSVLEGNYLPTRTPFGYKKVKEGKRQYLVPDPEKVPFLQLIFERYLAGDSCVKIGHTLDELGVKPLYADFWHENSLKKILKNDVYLGHTVWNRCKVEKQIEDGKLKKKRVPQKKPIIVYDTHEPLISQDTFDAVQSLMRSKSVKVNLSKELKSPYAGILRCKLCGKTMCYTSPKGGNVARYSCSSRSNCSNMSTNASVIDHAVISALKEHMTDFRIKLDQTDEDWIHQKRAMVLELEKKLDKLDQKKYRLYDLLEDGVYTKEKFVERLNKLEIEKKDLEAMIQKVRHEIPDRIQLEKQYTTLHEAIDMLQDPSISAKAKNTFLKQFISVIYYEKKHRDSTSHKNGAVEYSSNVNIEIVLK